MKSRSAFNILSLSSLLTPSIAWPLFFPPSIVRRAPVSYSVVAVGGGSTTSDAPPTATITDAVTRTATVMETQLSTIVITGLETTTTIVVTVTSPSPTTITDHSPAMTTSTASPTQAFSASSSQRYPAESSSSIAPSIAPGIATETLSPVTVTVTQSLPSSRPYDDGMWHTYYYYTVTPESSSNWTPGLSTTSPPTSSLEIISETPAATSMSVGPIWGVRPPMPTPP